MPVSSPPTVAEPQTDDASVAAPKEAPSGSIRNSLFWSSFGQAAFFVLQFGSTVVIARLLSPHEMGVFAIAQAAVGLISIAQALGLNNYLIRAKDIDKPVLATVFTINMGLSAGLSLITVGVGLVSGRIFQDPGSARVMMWLATTPIINGLAIVPASLLQRNGDFRALSLIRISSTLLGTGLTVGMAFFGFSYMSLAYGWVLTCATTSLGSCVLGRRFLQFSPGLSAWRRITGFGFTMILINGVTQVQRQLLNLAMGRILGLASLGLGSRANSLFSTMSDNIQTVAVRVFLVDFARAARNGEELRERYKAVIEFMTALLWPIFAGLAVLAAPCVHLLYGDKWRAVAIPLALLSISGMFWVAVAMAWELFIVANETHRQARIEIVRVAFGTPLFIAGCFVNLNVAIATRMIESAFAVFLYNPHIRRITGGQKGDLPPVYIRSGVLTGAAIAPSVLVMSLYQWSALTPLYAVFGGIVAGVGLYVLTLVLMKHPLLNEVEVIRKMLRRLRR